ncbi:SulP family inorganic anion transporter [Leptobacterium flavescens]|uniref:SulP family inorganic anion transporter n=1 Tax=Leptobacterium flavescens TaxID=472055 RepID=A0A6P0UR53_9FLAO|nr:SulP family inorganic anion transporter [Leptobacterium flavescens]NER14239.1 SulP family inorganic anion transporter [Leptobacterium flavescens]
MGPKKNRIKTFIGELPKNIFSGFVVSLIALPLGLGLAIASEAPPISGIIAAIVGGTVVAILGGSNVTITGPGNGLVIVLLSAITTLGGGDLYQGYLLTLGAIVISGILMILLGFLRLGILSDFFPASAIQGMLAAIGIGIFAKQFHVMVGQIDTKGSIIELLLKIPAAISNLFVSAPMEVMVAAAVGVGSLLIMVFYSKIRNKYFQLIPAPMWIVILTVGLSYYYQYFSSDPYPISQKLLVSLPNDIVSNLAFPDFSKVLDSNFINAVIAITLISSIESLLSIKAVDKLDPQKRRSNVNKDLKALGAATTLSGFLGGLNVVTVIARSSVNVNNGGSNRSANFFHALFLVLFIVLFQEQLKRIPLPALAAILVYTGYKLAAPESVRRVSKIGNEQLLIFFITLFSTIATNLITGILIGILTTFLIHIIINRSLSLFLGNALKPNVLMFKEGDKGNYYVSVKNFCSFLNFYKLKAKLDAIPEDKEAVVDFSMCDFVDHTVMESLNAYQQTFMRKGGNFEVIGLDAHEADSVHPFAIRKIIPFQTIIKVDKNLTKRQRLISEVAKDFTWSYEPKKERDVSFLYDFIYFETKQIKHVYNQLFDQEKELNLFDIEYSEGEFIAKEVIRSTMLFIKIDGAMPVFTLDKEGFLEVIYQWAGFKDVDIEAHSDFSKRFYLRGEDEEGIRRLFTDELVLFFESNPYYHVESNGDHLIIKNKERLASVKEIKMIIDFGLRLKTIIQKQLVC